LSNWQGYSYGASITDYYTGYFDVAIVALEALSPEDKKVDPKPPTVIPGPGKRPPTELPDDESPKLKRMKAEAATEETVC
jgi:hypothetical protein